LTQYSSTFSTKAAGAGYFIGSSPANDPGIPGTGTAGTATATLALAAWYSNQGQYPTLASAEGTPGVPYGWSPLFTVGSLGNTGSPPNTPPNLTGLQSFSLVTSPTPEPGTIALGVMGAAAFLARRRTSK
jgi:hypothetical protein